MFKTVNMRLSTVKRVGISAALALSVVGCGRSSLLDAPLSPDMAQYRPDLVQNSPDMVQNNSPDMAPFCAVFSGGVPQNSKIGVAKVTTNIGDYFDRTSGDRKPKNDPASVYPLNVQDTDKNANPFTDNNNGSIAANSDGNFRRIGSEYPVFADQTVPVGAQLYAASQSFWVEGDAHFSSDVKDVVANLPELAFSMKLDGTDGTHAGIPVCTTPDKTGNYAACDSTSNDRSVSKGITVSLLGEDWVVTSMTPPAVTGNTNQQGNLPNDTLIAPGGTIKIAKVAMRQVLTKCQSLGFDNMTLAFSDIEKRQDGTLSVIVTLFDANGKPILEDTITPGTTDEKTVNGKKYRFHIFSATDSQVDLALLSDELELDHGKDIDSPNHPNNGWHVALGWKNTKPELGSNAPDTLRSIVFWADDLSKLSSNGTNMLNIGDYVPLISQVQLVFQGLDAMPADRDDLRFQLKFQDRIIPAQSGPIFAGKQMACKIFGPFVEVTSGTPGAFSVPRFDNGGQGNLSADSFMIAINSAQNAHPALCDTNFDGVIDEKDVNANFPIAPGSVFMLTTAIGLSYGMATKPFAADWCQNGLVVGYSLAGDGNASFSAGGAIVIPYNLDCVNPSNFMQDFFNSAGFVHALGNDPKGIIPMVPDRFFAVAERSSKGFANYLIFGIDQTGTGVATDATFEFNSVDKNGNSLTSDNHKVLYGHATSNPAPNYYNGPSKTGPVQSGVELQDEGYITERGSVTNSISSETVQLSMARRAINAVLALIKN